MARGSLEYLLHYIRRLQDNMYDTLMLCSGDKGVGKSSATISLAMKYIDRFGFICPNCKAEFFKNVYALKEGPSGNPVFYIPDYVTQNRAWIKCPEHYELDLRTGQKKKVSGCGHKFLWSQRKKIKWDAAKFIAYDNADVVKKIFELPHFSPLICLNGDTKVTIKDKQGIRKEIISKLKDRSDFEILSYNTEKNIFEFKKPEKCIETHKQAKVFEIELENGTKIKATEDHQFYTNRGYVALKDLNSDDEILTWSKECEICDTEFAPVNYNNVQPLWAKENLSKGAKG